MKEKTKRTTPPPPPHHTPHPPPPRACRLDGGGGKTPMRDGAPTGSGGWGRGRPAAGEDRALAGLSAETWFRVREQTALLRARTALVGRRWPARSLAWMEDHLHRPRRCWLGRQRRMIFRGRVAGGDSGELNTVDPGEAGAGLDTWGATGRASIWMWFRGRRFRAGAGGSASVVAGGAGWRWFEPGFVEYAEALWGDRLRAALGWERWTGSAGGGRGPRATTRTRRLRTARPADQGASGGDRLGGGCASVGAQFWWRPFDGRGNLAGRRGACRGSRRGNVTLAGDRGGTGHRDPGRAGLWAGAAWAVTGRFEFRARRWAVGRKRRGVESGAAAGGWKTVAAMVELRGCDGQLSECAPWKRTAEDSGMSGRGGHRGENRPSWGAAWGGRWGRLSIWLRGTENGRRDSRRTSSRSAPGRAR